MKTRTTTVFCALLAFLLALGLVACGGPTEDAGTDGQEEQGSEAPAEEAPVETQPVFEGRQARDQDDLDEYIQKAVDLAKARASVSYKDREEADLNAEVTGDFAKANEAYRAGRYKEASDGYEQILKTYAQHYGANVNLTLALLQQEKNDQAFAQALSCCYLFPDDVGPMLNAQVAGVACDFGITDVEYALDQVLSQVDSGFLKALEANRETDANLSDQFTYNELWDLMETDLYESSSAVGASREEQYQHLVGLMDDLAQTMGDDKDYQALRAYFEAIGQILGNE